MIASSLPAVFIDRTATVTLGMGCFWSPEALFGSLPGVIRTRVGYAGGTTPDPVYRRMGDHTETVEIGYDPTSVTLEELLQLFWDRHNPLNINGYKGRQYQSLLLYRDGKQRETMEAAWRQRADASIGRGPEADGGTEIAPYRAFYPAEERHQKYYLKRYPNALAGLRELYPDEAELAGSTLAARLNGLAKGFTSLQRLLEEIERWPASGEQKERIISILRQIRW